jgi:hypothetical protein
MIERVVYLLCAVTSIACAWLLYRGYRESRTKLLFWSGLCFLGLALNNVLLVVDMIILPDADLSLPRTVTALVAMIVLVVGLIWETIR